MIGVHSYQFYTLLRRQFAEQIEQSWLPAFSLVHKRKRKPQRQAQMRERVAPLLGQLVARAKDQGGLRPDIVPPDFPILQLMLGAVTEHIGQPDLWRRYLAVLIDGMRARSDLKPLPELRMARGEFRKTIIASSTREAHRRAAED